MRMRSVMSHAFSQIPRAEIPRSSFDRSHGYKTTFDAGYLVPIFLDEALPGDTFNLKMDGFARVATPIFPIMDNMRMETFFFAVPMRLIWNNWERFNGAQDEPDDSTDFTIPQFAVSGGFFNTGSLGDYFGLPVGKPFSTVSGSCLPFRAYNLIFNEWFRDQNIQNSVTVSKGDGPDTVAGTGGVHRRNKRHDYFTSCLPWPQKGDAVSLPLAGNAVVKTAGDPLFTGVQPPLFFLNAASGGAAGGNGGLMATGSPASLQQGSVSVAPSSGTTLYPSNLYADLASVTAATINELRQAFQVQRLLERDARGGTRYTEILRSHFGVISPDARLQRPEYLGGGSTPVNISSVPQTSETATTPQGNMAAFGTVSLHNHGFVKSFTEHCLIIGLVNVRADLTYQQGIDRMWNRETRFDFYWPALSHIGEQAVLTKEIFYNDAATDEEVFGYQERYAEYRYKPSKITGLFRSGITGSLDSWHLSQEFSAAPTLDSAFIVEDPPLDRCIAVTDEPHFLFDAYFSMRCARPMPVYGVPGMIDHF